MQKMFLIGFLSLFRACILHQAHGELMESRILACLFTKFDPNDPTDVFLFKVGKSKGCSDTFGNVFQVFCAKARGF